MSDSFWKKEISFRHKAGVDPADEPESPKQSLWKKELSLSRKPKAERPAQDEREKRTPLWKKELSLSRPKRDKRDKAVERLAQEAAQAVAPVPASPIADVPPPTALAEAVLAAMPDVTAPPPPPAPALPAEAPDVAELPVSVPALPDVAAAAEPWLAPPAVPPAPLDAAAPVVVHPPVPEAELPPLPEEPKTPFWKKELSFSRTPKAEQSAQAPKTPFWKQELSLGRKPKAEQPAPEPAAPKTPFWKKELSLGRKPKPAAAAAESAAPKTAAPPFWKRQLSLPSLSLPRPAARGRGKAHHKASRLVGLKVGSSQLAAARVSNNGSIELLQVAREPLAHGVVVAGELREPEALAASLKQFFARHKLPRKNVRLGIASNRIGVRIFDVAGIADEKQLENAVHFRAQETLPIPLDEAVLDYHILDESVDDEGNPSKRILLVVAYRELIDRYVSACKKAGISLVGIDLEAFALLRSLSAPRPAAEAGDSAVVVVAIGHDRSTFAVSDGRACEFTRVLDWGGATLNVAIARTLNLAPSEAETIKRALSLESNELPAGVAADTYALALDSARKQVQGFARELVSSLQFYQNQPGSLGIAEIVITGGTAALAGLAGELQRLIGVQVRVGDPLARVKVSKRVDAGDDVGSLAVAIGLGIEDD